MKRIKILILLLLPVMALNSQTWGWAKSCGMFINGYGDGTSVCTDPTGNVFITGLYHESIVAGNYTLNCTGWGTYLIKYDNNGNVLWAQSLSPCAPSFTSQNYGISVCSDAIGNALVTGPCLYGSAAKNTFLTKYDPSGTVLWIQTSIDTSYDNPYSVSCDASNNIYVAGVFKTSMAFGTTTLTGIGGGNFYSQNLYLIKFDPNGNVIWAKTNSFGKAYQDGSYWSGVSVAAEANGNVFVTGGFTSPSLVLGTYTLTNSGSVNIFLAKYDANGNVLWAKNAAGTGTDQASSVSADGIGNAYITGYYTSPTVAFGTNSISNAGYKNMFVAKYDGNGNNLWVKNSANTSNSPTYLKGCSVSSNSISVFVAGNTPSLLTIGTNTFSTASVNYPTFITRFDGNGNLVYGQVLSDGGDDWVAVCTDRFCNAYITGDFSSGSPFIIGSNTLTAVGGENTFTAKLSYSASCGGGIDGINEISNSNTQNRLYPNPSSGLFNLQIENKINDGVLILYNSLGQQVYQQKIMQGVNEIRTTGFPSGLYHYTILQDKKTTNAGKIVIE